MNIMYSLTYKLEAHLCKWTASFTAIRALLFAATEVENHEPSHSPVTSPADSESKLQSWSFFLIAITQQL